MKIYKWKPSLLRAAVVLIGVFACGAVSAQVSGTKHNLGSTGTLAPAVNASTAEVCVFCHTPHGSATGAAVPLWNKSLNDPLNYTTYDSINSASLEGEIVNVGSVSIACLSCHDGTQAMDSMLNEPGSGAIATGTFTASIGTMAVGIANLGEDLSNDHPVGIQYAGGGVTAAILTGADPDFKATQTPVNLNGTTVWWVDTAEGTAGERDKTDMILYTRTDGTLGAQEPFVECASCHDPHTSNALFLRTANTGSAVCLACHTK